MKTIGFAVVAVAVAIVGGTVVQMKKADASPQSQSDAPKPDGLREHSMDGGAMRDGGMNAPAMPPMDAPMGRP